jgi:hypothetical protein
VTNQSTSSFIVSKKFDYAFFIFSPLASIVIAIACAYISYNLSDDFPIFKDETNPFIFLGAIFTMAHICIVLFRSHLNKKIFKEFPIRFTFIPAIIYLSMLISPYIFAFISILIVWWDVYHSGLQTFGLARIYDSKAKNDPNIGRRVDYFFNLFLYIGPIFGGIALMDHIDMSITDWRVLNKAIFHQAPVVAENHSTLATIFLSAGVLFLLFYISYFTKLKKKGYNFPKPKLLLYISTGLTSIYAWGFNPLGYAFFIMNLFHAVQYFAIVYIFEKDNIASNLRVTKSQWKKFIIIFILFVPALFLGLLANQEGPYPPGMLLLPFFHTLSLIHFWYDGFIWSVRKKHVQ